MPLFGEKTARLRTPLALIIDSLHPRYGQIGVNYAVIVNTRQDTSEYQFYFLDGESITILDDWQKPIKFIEFRTIDDINRLVANLFVGPFPVSREESKKSLQSYQ